MAKSMGLERNSKFKKNYTRLDKAKIVFSLIKFFDVKRGD